MKLTWREEEAYGLQIREVGEDLYAERERERECVSACVRCIWKSLAMQCMVGVTRHRMFEIFEVI